MPKEKHGQKQLRIRNLPALARALSGPQFLNALAFLAGSHTDVIHSPPAIARWTLDTLIVQQTRGRRVTAISGALTALADGPLQAVCCSLDAGQRQFIARPMVPHDSI